MKYKLGKYKGERCNAALTVIVGTPIEDSYCKNIIPCPAHLSELQCGAPLDEHWFDACQNFKPCKDHPKGFE